MSNIKKILIKILQGNSDQNIRFSELCLILDRLGFNSRVKGSHHTNKYEVIIYWSSEDDSFIAEVPELAGCAADGKTYLEALKNVQGIIVEWIETARKLNRPIPEPRGRLAYA